MSIAITFGPDGITVEDQQKAANRPGRGHSVLQVASDYVALDLETTGLDPAFCSIIEIGAIRVRGGQPVDKYQTLVQPDDLADVDDYITELTGITPEMLADAPKIADVIPQALDFIGADLLLGHNAAFDINFLYDAADAVGLTFSNNYLDTLRWSRRLYPTFKNHKLQTLIKEFDIGDTVEHRALGDADMARQCYDHMIHSTPAEQLDALLAASHHNHTRAADIKAQDAEAALTGPWSGQMFVFTGALERFTRKEAMQVVADLGGINGDNVTKKTHYLVLGNNDFCKSIKGGKSTKQKKAEKLILAGQDLQIITENVFYDMLCDAQAEM